jgi:hypothetical protein
LLLLLILWRTTLVLLVLLLLLRTCIESSRSMLRTHGCTHARQVASCQGALVVQQG